jgi:hypothetical protein
MKNDVEHIGEKIKAPETQATIRRELLAALQTMNTELQKVIDRWSAADSPGETPGEDGPTNNPAE